MVYIETVQRRKDRPAGTPRYAVFDFDGTISLIREGWQEIMTPYFTEELMNTPEGRRMPESQVENICREFITLLTGKQTIYQCIRLAEEVDAFGGKPKDPQEYKDEYLRRLLIKIDGRIRGLEEGTIDPPDITVNGSFALLDMLESHGVSMYLTSGTDEEHVLKEASLLKVDRYFKGHIYGAQKEYRTFSKKLVIEKMMRDNRLEGSELIGFGDGYVEIENIAEAGGFAVGVASNERERKGIDSWKRERLIKAGADIIIPDFSDVRQLEELLFG